jgi:hypothetical protein
MLLEEWMSSSGPRKRPSSMYDASFYETTNTTFSAMRSGSIHQATTVNVFMLHMEIEAGAA